MGQKIHARKRKFMAIGGACRSPPIQRQVQGPTATNYSRNRSYCLMGGHAVVCLTAGHVVDPRSDVSRAAQVEPMRKSLYLQNPQRLIVLGVALIATLLLTPNGRADHQDPVPRFSQSQLAQQFPSLPAGGTW